MISLFRGPAALAQMVREELAARGVAAELRSEDPLGSILGSVAAPAGMQSVLVTEAEAELHRPVIDDVLSMVSDGEVEVESPDENE